MADIRLGPFLVGIDHRSPEVSMPQGSLRDAINLDLDREGNMRRRAGLALLQASPHAGTVWTSRLGLSFVQIGDTLYRANYGGSLTLAAVATLNSVDPVSLDEFLDGVVYANRTSIGIVKSDGTARPLGVEDVQAFAAAADPAGGLPAGMYGVGLTFTAGAEEGAMGALSFVQVPEGGGIRLTLPTPQESTTTGINVYMTGSNGDALRLRAKAPRGMGTFLVGQGEKGRLCETQNKWRTLPGSIVRNWHGRLLVARGRVLYFTDALRYGVIDPRHGFVQEARPITMVEPVDGGVFVGTDLGVWFYRGTRPKEWVRVPTDSKPPVAGASTTVPAVELGGDVGGQGVYVAVWLTARGYVVGTTQGALVQPQAQRINLAADRGALLVHDRKAVAVVF